MVATEVSISPGASPRANCRAATAAAWWRLDWCIPITMTLTSMAMTSTTTGRMTANSAVTEPSVDFFDGGMVTPEGAGACAPAVSLLGLETQSAFNETFQQALDRSGRYDCG